VKGAAVAERPTDQATEELVQIGDLARRTGLSVDVLRAWERRYGLLHPRRSAGGFRLYSSRDEDTVRAMLAQIDRGFPPAQAAKLALAQPTLPASSVVAPRPAAPGADGALTLARADLYAALSRFHGSRAHQLIDEFLAGFTVDAVLSEVVLPCLADLGDGWERGAVTIAQEHFASSLLRERLLGLARPWDRGSGPRAILACPPNERHDIALICFGLALGRSGWRITFLGADTPVGTVAEAANALQPNLVVFASIMDGQLAAVAPAIRELAAARPVHIAGRDATADLARSTGTVLLTGSPVAAANQLVSLSTAGRWGPSAT
jgi:MerR family transcriptional regulator, light-induced transcriptional regulator